MAGSVYPARAMKTVMSKNMTKKRRKPHYRFLTDYLQARHSDNEYHPYVRLGSIPEELQPGVLTEPELREIQAVRCMRADAVVIKPEKVTIIKARVVANPQDIRILPMHGQLFRHTRQFVDYWDLDIKLRYVCAVDNNTLREFAGLHNIELVHFRPEWVDSHLNTLRHRDRRPMHFNIADFLPTITETALCPSDIH